MARCGRGTFRRYSERRGVGVAFGFGWGGAASPTEPGQPAYHQRDPAHEQHKLDMVRECVQARDMQQAAVGFGQHRQRRDPRQDQDQRGGRPQAIKRRAGAEWRGNHPARESQRQHQQQRSGGKTPGRERVVIILGAVRGAVMRQTFQLGPEQVGAERHAADRQEPEQPGDQVAVTSQRRAVLPEAVGDAVRECPKHRGVVLTCALCITRAILVRIAPRVNFGGRANGMSPSPLEQLRRGCV